MKTPKKNPHAVALGKRGSRARNEILTAEQRSAIARKAINARWDAVRAARAADAAKPVRRVRKVKAA
jgi:hypothetical protein